ncbi:MAG: hypothetical protein PHH49_02845 [Candidatus Omnitrophica bacterium]|nr:hypothetical protein [Candidatus Omnitrophota bacterium]MDD5487887.1 hypothetical protein [Candidatus Omnitrophota bacterium]
MFKKVVTLSIMISSILVWNVHAENMDFLKDEIREAQRHLDVIGEDHARAKKFLEDYPKTVEEISKAAVELRQLDAKMRDILQKNLVKSTIALGIETYGKINLVMGFYRKAVMMILLSCRLELHSDSLQKEYSTPYDVAIKGLSDEAVRTLPELEKINETLGMDLDEVKDEALKQGDKLGDTGAIYRKFQMVLEEIKKAQDKMIALRKKLDQANNEVENVFPELNAEVQRLSDRIKELQERINKASQEEAEEKEKALRSEIQNMAQVPVKSVAPIIVSSAEEAERIKRQLLAQLSSTVQSYSQRCNEIDRRMEEMATSDTSGLRMLSPSPNYPSVSVYTESEIMGMDVTKLRNEAKILGRIAKYCEFTISILDRSMSEYSDLGESARNDIGSLLGQIASLGGNGEGIAAPLMKRIASVEVKNPKMIGMMNVSIENAEKNVNNLENEFNRKKSLALDAAKSFVTDSQGALNSLREAQGLRKQVIDECKGVGMKISRDEYSSGDMVWRLQGETKKMFAEGRTADEVGAYLGEKRDALISLYDKAAKSARLEALAEKMRRKVLTEYAGKPGIAFMYDFANNFPDEGIKNEVDKFGTEWMSYMYWTGTDNQSINRFIENTTYKMTDTINDFLVLLPKIKDANDRIEKAFSEGEYNKAVYEYNVIMEELAKDSPIFDKWLSFYASPAPGKHGIYKVVSVQGQKAMETAKKKLEEAQSQENKKKMEELARQEEERRKKEEDDYYKSLGYNVGGVRVNTVVLPRTSGEVTLMNNDLMDGEIEVEGYIDNLHDVRVILAAEDGEAWRELPLEGHFKYRFRPFANRPYSPVIRLKMNSSDDITLDLLAPGQTLVYKDMDYTQLIVETVTKLAEAYERESLAIFAPYISKDFLGNKTFLEEGLRFDFDMFNDIRLSIFINRIEKGRDYFSVETKWNKSQVVYKTGQQQRTSGNTVMVFVFEDGKMKLYNLRGNLIYATLSPEIAEASGLSQSVVEQITEARNSRNPVQPGAGDTEENGGLSSGGAPISTRQGTVTCVPGGPAGARGFDFTAGNPDVAPGQGGNPNADIDLEYADQFWSQNGARIQDVTATYTYGELTTAPDVVDAGTVNPLPGKVYLIRTSEGYYGKVRITNYTDNVGVSSTVTFDYAIQTDGSRNIATN